MTKNYRLFFEDVKKWQVDVMGNNCTVCHGNNMHNQCNACGWYGKVNPDDPEGLLPSSAPSLMDSKYDMGVISNR